MSSSRAIRRCALIGGLAAAALSWATAGQAAVIYDFKWFADDDPQAALLGSFRFTAIDFITGRIDVNPEDLDACAVSFPGSKCSAQALDPDSAAFGEPGFDVVVFNYNQVASRVRPAVHFFEDGSFRTAGVHEQIVSDYISQLTVTVVPNAVPEPATWALMILGFGLAGTGIRRGQPALAS
jgi:hypothetical protein